MQPTLEEILRLELRVWEALKSGDASLDARLLSDDFLGVYPTGFSAKQPHCDQLKDGPTVASYELLEPRLIIFNTELVLLSYLTLWSRICDGRPQKQEKMYISSIWQRSGREWKNVFSQDTPTERLPADIRKV